MATQSSLFLLLSYLFFNNNLKKKEKKRKAVCCESLAMQVVKYVKIEVQHHGQQLCSFQFRG